MVVKPADADNSLGVTLVRDRAGYDAALEAAFAHADEVLVERFVELGREVRCGIVVQDGRLVCLPLEEYDVDATLKPVRGYEDKLARDPAGELELMAKDGRKAWIVDVDDPVTEPVWQVARRVPRSPRLQALQPVRLPRRPRGAALVPRGRASTAPSPGRA